MKKCLPVDGSCSGTSNPYLCKFVLSKSTSKNPTITVGYSYWLAVSKHFFILQCQLYIDATWMFGGGHFEKLVHLKVYLRLLVSASTNCRLPSSSLSNINFLVAIKVGKCNFVVFSISSVLKYKITKYYKNNYQLKLLNLV